VGDASDLPALERAAHDSEPLIAEHAQWALTQIRFRLGPETVTSMVDRNQLNPKDMVVASYLR
jgi:hypothetical protein